MKRTVSVLLAVLFAFSLSACGKTLPPGGSGGDPGTTAPVKVTTEDQTPVFSLPDLPDIGEFAPDNAPQKSFFPDGPADSFTPRDDYGVLVPYVAEALWLHSPKYDTWTDPDTGEIHTEERGITENRLEPHWGLATADGRVVTGGLFEKFDAYEYQDGRILYCLRPCEEHTEYEEGEVSYRAILTDGEGRWALERTVWGGVECLFDFGLPVFLTKDVENGTALFYDLDGKLVADFSRFARVRDGYLDFPNVVYADENGALLFDPPDETDGRNSGSLAFVGWDGRIIRSGREDYANIFYMGGSALIARMPDDQYVLTDTEGARLTESEYEFLAYSDVTEGFIGCLTNSAWEQEAQYLDKNGNPCEVRTAWSDETRYLLYRDYLVSDPNGNALLFMEKEYYFEACDLRGGKIRFPVNGNEMETMELISEMSDLYAFSGSVRPARTEYSPEDPQRRCAVFIHADDGRSYLCAADGTLLSEIEEPKILRTEYGKSMYITMSAGKFFVVTEEGDLVVYGSDGGRLAREEGFILRGAADADSRDFNLWHFGKSFFGVRIANEDYTDYSPDDFLLYRKTDYSRSLGAFSVVASLPGGGLAACSQTQSWLFDPDGNVLLRFTLPVFY